MRAAACNVLVVGLVLCPRATVGLAAEDPEALIRQGIELRKAGEDARAEGYFRRAYDLAATPRTAAQLGLAELAVNDFVHAEVHLTEALGYHDAWILEHLDALKDSRDMARRNLFHVEMAGAPPNATVTLDGESPRPLSPGGVVWLDPGRSATIKIEAPGRRPAVLRINGSAGEGRRIALEMPATEETPAAGPGAAPAALVERGSTDHPPGNGLRIAGIATAVVGAAVGALGAVFYEQGTTKLHEYQNAIRSNGAIPWNPQDGDWESARDKGAALLIAGSIAVVGGATLFLLGSRREAEHAGAVSVTLAPNSGGAFFSYRRSF